MLGFHKDRRNKDGRGRICKVCWKAKYTVAQETSRKTPEGRKHLSQQRRGRGISEIRRARERRHSKKRRVAYPEKARAHRATRAAIARSELERPIICQKCGETPLPRRDGVSLIQAHHQDYSKALDVDWLCVFCHAAEHRTLKDRSVEDRKP